METISFVLKPDISADQRKSLLSEVQKHPDCSAVRSLGEQPGLKATSSAARICHAKCKDLESAKKLKQFVAAQSVVQSVSIETKRGLAGD